MPGVAIASQLAWLQGHVEEPQLKALENVRKQAQRILDEPILFHYTDHTSTHSDRVLNNIRALVSDNLAAAPPDLKLNDLELIILAASAYLHDIGMQTPIFEQKKLERCFLDYELAEKVRKRHGECSGEMIAKSISRSRGDYPTLGLDQDQILEDLAPSIKRVCEQHSGPGPDLSHAEYLYNKQVRVGLLTAILRLADALDLHQQRVQLEKLKRFEIPLGSQVHWWRHYYVQAVILENGMISIHMCFPTDFSGVYEDYFKNKVLNEISRELSLCQKVLFPNWIRWYLDDGIKVSHDESSTRRALPSALKEYIDNELETNAESYETIKERLRKVEPVQAKKSDWMSYWRFKGNPWTDNPLYYQDAEFVLTKNVKQVLDEMSSFREGKRGELRLLVGERGSGKTTFFNATSDVLKSSNLRIRYIDVLEGITALRHPAEIYDFIMRRIFEFLNIDSGVEYSEKDLREVIRNYRLNKMVIGVDNLDQFNEEQDLPIIRQFFRMSQSLIQDLKAKCILVISCSPKWSGILQSLDLSYLGFNSAWQLRPFNEQEVAELLAKRLSASSLRFEDVFSADVLPLLVLMTEGNPRRVVQIAEQWCKLAASQEVKPVTRKFLEKSMVYEIVQQSRVLIAQIACKSKSISEAVSRVYLFNRDMDRTHLPADRGWAYFANIVDHGLLVDEVDGQYETALSKVATKFSKKIADTDRFEVKWLPRSMTKDFFEQWKKGGLSFADFVTAYRSDPFVPPDFDRDALNMVDPNKLAREAREPFEEAKEKFETVVKTKLPPLKAIEDSWDIVQLLLESLYIHYGVVDAQKLQAWKKRDHLNRVRMTAQERVDEAWGYFKLLTELSAKVGYISYFEDIQFILRKREKVLKTPAKYLSQFSERDGEICVLAVKKIYAELTGIFLRSSS